MNLPNFFPHRVASLVCAAAWTFSPSAMSATGEWSPLFNGKDLEGWRPLLDPASEIGNFLEIADGEIHIYAKNVAPNAVPFGVLMTAESFGRFHLRLEYRWGTKKFEPRANDIRDAGILYHIYDASKVWPKSVECQIQEGDTGDLIFLSTGGVSWVDPKPQDAPEGQGDPGMLPEMGGLARAFSERGFGPYLGRFPDPDKPTDWNTVEVIVHGAESAVHIVNGEVLARVFEMRKPVGNDGWETLNQGPIAIQLEGAELFYRNIELRELPPALEPSTRYVTASSVGNAESSVQTLTVTNPGPELREIDWEVLGESPELFEVSGPADKALPPGESATIEVKFGNPEKAGRYSAGLRIGGEDDGAFVVLQGVRLSAMEGSNEPPLARILDALGTSADVGGPDLAHDTGSETLGNSVAGGRFRALGEVTVTPLARFSPPGAIPFGYSVDGNATELGSLADSKDQSDAHQCVWPPIDGGEGSVRFAAPAQPFALFAKPEGMVLSTDPSGSEGAKVKHPARVWPIRVFQGRMIENAFLVGFEEASNGDYQDALFLVENVELATPPAAAE